MDPELKEASSAAARIRFILPLIAVTVVWAECEEWCRDIGHLIDWCRVASTLVI
jgi:hypothetical protein